MADNSPIKTPPLCKHKEIVRAKGDNGNGTFRLKVPVSCGRVLISGKCSKHKWDVT